MAKESMKAREVKRAKLANRYAHKREEIAAKVKSGEMDHEEAWQALAKLPRNSNPIRQHNRCKITGRPKGSFACSASAVSSSAKWPRRG